MFIFFIPKYPTRMFLYQSSKNKNLKQGKNNYGKYNIQEGYISGITSNPIRQTLKPAMLHTKHAKSSNVFFFTFIIFIFCIQPYPLHKAT